MAEQIEVSIVGKVDKGSLKRSKDQMQKFARDTGKELDLKVVATLEINRVGLENELAIAKKQLKNFKGTADQKIDLQVKTNRLKENLTQAKRELKNYTNTGSKNVSRLQEKFNGIWKSILSSLVNPVTLGIAAIASLWKIVSNTVKSFRDFDKIQRQLQAIAMASGSTAEEVSRLSDNAKELGKSTRFTSAEVSQLQLELTKLWFSSDQILDLTESSLNLAAAFGQDLGETAKTVGATLKIYGLNASEATRVNDVMASSFANSALDLEKFSTAITDAWPVAKTFGFSLEETTALLGVLSSAGFDASKAGTATRNILLNLADGSWKLAKALWWPVETLPELVAWLKKLKSEGIDLAETLELTDKRSVAAFNSFLDGTDSIDKLNAALENAWGTAEKLANEQLKGIDGALTLMSSAFDGLSVAIWEALAPMIIWLAKFITWLLSASEVVPVFSIAITALWVAIAIAWGPITSMIASIVALIAVGKILVDAFSITKNEISWLSGEIDKTRTSLEKLDNEFESWKISVEEYIKKQRELKDALRDLEKEYKVVNKEINKNNRAIRKWENFIIWYTNGIRETNQEIVRLQNAVDGWNTGFSIFGVTIVDNEAKIERLKERTAEYETELENLKQKNIETARTNQILSWGFGTVENAINDISTAKTISEFNALKTNALELLKVFATIQGEQLAIARESGATEEAAQIRNRLKSLGDTVQSIKNIEFKAATEVATKNNDVSAASNSSKVSGAKKTQEDINKIFINGLEEQRRAELKSIERSGDSKEEQLLSVIQLEKKLLDDLREWWVASGDAIKKAYERIEDALFSLKTTSKTAFEWLSKNVEWSLDKIKEIDKEIQNIDDSLANLGAEWDERVANRLRDIQEERAELQEELDELNQLQSNITAQIVAGQIPTSQFWADEVEKRQEIIDTIASLQEEATLAQQNTTEEALEKIDGLRAESETERILREVSEEEAKLQAERDLLQISKDLEVQILKNFFDQGKELAAEYAESFDESLKIPEERLSRMRDIAAEIQSLSGVSVGQSFANASTAWTTNNNQQSFENTFNVNSTIDLLQASRQIALDSNR